MSNCKCQFPTHRRVSKYMKCYWGSKQAVILLGYLFPLDDTPIRLVEGDGGYRLILESTDKNLPLRDLAESIPGIHWVYDKDSGKQIFIEAR